MEAGGALKGVQITQLVNKINTQLASSIMDAGGAFSGAQITQSAACTHTHQR
jgi:hypothetical protein